MSEETPEIESEEPRKRLRRRAWSKGSSESSEVTSASQANASASGPDVTPEVAPAMEAEEEAAAVSSEVDPQAASKEPGAPAKPAPSRRRGRRREPGAPIPVVRAQAKYVRSSARKARLVCDHIRGKSVEEARAILAHTPRAIARDWSKLLESAVANAEHNHELVGEDLYVKAVKADEGPTIKRFRPRAMGRATKIRKRTSHLTILLTPKE